MKRREEDEIVMHTFDAKRSTSPFTGTKSNLRDRVLGEVEKDSFIALPGKGGEQQASALRTMYPSLGKIVTKIVIV